MGASQSLNCITIAVIFCRQLHAGQSINHIGNQNNPSMTNDHLLDHATCCEIDEMYSIFKEASTLSWSFFFVIYLLLYYFIHGIFERFEQCLSFSYAFWSMPSRPLDVKHWHFLIVWSTFGDNSDVMCIVFF